MNLVTCPICERHYIADVPAEIELHAQLHYRLGRSSWPPALTEHIKALGWALAYNDGGLTRRQWSQEAGRLMVVYAWWEDEVFRGTAPEEFETFIAMRLKFVAAKVAHDLPAIERAEAEYRAWQARQLAAHQPTPRDACWSAALQAGYLYVPARTYRGQELIREWHAWCAQHRRPAVSVQVRGACAEVRLVWEGSARKLAAAVWPRSRRRSRRLAPRGARLQPGVLRRRTATPAASRCPTGVTWRPNCWRSPQPLTSPPPSCAA